MLSDRGFTNNLANLVTKFILPLITNKRLKCKIITKNTDFLLILILMDSLNVYVIAGCNGAGKTTASYTILPQILNCNEFINADEIAKGLSPFQPEKVAFEAGRIMLNRFDQLILTKLVLLLKLH